jgi:hypothetical protein
MYLDPERKMVMTFPCTQLVSAMTRQSNVPPRKTPHCVVVSRSCVFEARILALQKCRQRHTTALGLLDRESRIGSTVAERAVVEPYQDIWRGGYQIMQLDRICQRRVVGWVLSFHGLAYCKIGEQQGIKRATQSKIRKTSRKRTSCFCVHVRKPCTHRSFQNLLMSSHKLARWSRTQGV